MELWTVRWLSLSEVSLSAFFLAPHTFWVHPTLSAPPFVQSLFMKFSHFQAPIKLMSQISFNSWGDT